MFSSYKKIDNRMKTITQMVKERSFFHYSKRDNPYAKQAFVMDCFWRLQRQRKWECSDTVILLSEIWQAARVIFKEWGVEVVRVVRPYRTPDLSDYYTNRPSGTYTGD